MIVIDFDLEVGKYIIYKDIDRNSKQKSKELIVILVFNLYYRKFSNGNSNNRVTAIVLLSTNTEVSKYYYVKLPTKTLPKNLFLTG